MSVDFDTPLLVGLPLFFWTLPGEMLRIVPYFPVPFITRAQVSPGIRLFLPPVQSLDLLQSVVVLDDGTAIGVRHEIPALVNCISLVLLPGRPLLGILALGAGGATALCKRIISQGLVVVAIIVLGLDRSTPCAWSRRHRRSTDRAGMAREAAGPGVGADTV